MSAPYATESPHLEEKKTSESDHAEYIHHDKVGATEEAAKYVNSSVVIDEATNKRLLGMLNRRVLPLMLLAYLMQALDKGTTSTASIMGLQADTNMVGQDYALTSTMLWIGIIIGEFPANRVVQVFPVGKLLSFSLVVWGVILLIMGFMRDYKPIFALRLLLGLTESIVGPALLSIAVMWYKKTEQPLVLAGYQSALGLNSIIAGLLGFGFYQVSGGSLKGWQYMFIMIAAISMISGVVMYFFLPDSPARATCYSEEDKVLFVERVRENDQGIKNKVWKTNQFYEAIQDPMVWMYFLMALFNTLVVGGINTFASILLNKNFGFSVTQSQLLNMPLGALTIILYWVTAWLVRKTKQTLFVMIGLVVVNTIGTIVLITVPNTNSTKGGLLAAFYLMQFFQAGNPLMFGLMGRNVAGSTKKTFAYALQFIGWAGGNAIAPQLFQSAWAPRYLNSLYIHLAIYGCFVTVCITSWFILRARNVKKISAQANSDGLEVKNAHEHAFEDLTDGLNPDFRYDL